MAKFRRKVEEFTAHQWKGEGTSVPGIEAVFHKLEREPNGGYNRYFVTIPGGQRLYLDSGDWVLYNEKNVPFDLMREEELRDIADEVL